jgi:hypothetical protein
MREHFKDEEDVKKKISDILFKALTQKEVITKEKEKQVNKEIWEVIDKAEKVVK